MINLVAIIIDLVLVLIIALFTFIGYKQGLVKAAIKIFSFFIAIAIALILYKPISNIVIEKTTVDDKIKSTMVENVKINEEENEESKEGSNILKNNLTNKIIAGANDTMEQIAGAFTIKIIEIGVILLLYVIARIVLKFISALTDLITKLPIIKQINKAGGTVYGFLKGIIIVYVLLGIIYLISPAIKSNALNEIDNTIITKYVYNNNVLLKIVF